MDEVRNHTRTAGEAGWYVSRYNLSARLPESDMTVFVNLLRGTCEELSPLEVFLLSELDQLDEHHPAIRLLERRGVICNFDELAALNTMGRRYSGESQSIGLVICPTMACNFNCPYCFEDHFAGMMSQEVQDDIVALAAKLFDVSRARALQVNWFGGEPLLAPEIIASLSERLIALAEERGATYEAGIVTNGYLLTQEIADMLGRARVNEAQITLDGLAASHDATRHLADGRPTFERITKNLRELHLPFCVHVRHNVTANNIDDIEPLKALVLQIAEESGNELDYLHAVVIRNEASDCRGISSELLSSSEEESIRLELEAQRFGRGRAYYCLANSLWSMGIDHLGNLQKCWEAVDKPRYSFGTAHDWDPADPFTTASNADLLTCYINTACPVPDKECQACVWLPHCVGACPHRRLFDGGRICVPYRGDPEAFVLAIHAYKQKHT